MENKNKYFISNDESFNYYLDSKTLQVYCSQKNNEEILASERGSWIAKLSGGTGVTVSAVTLISKWIIPRTSPFFNALIIIGAISIAIIFELFMYRWVRKQNRNLSLERKYELMVEEKGKEIIESATNASHLLTVIFVIVPLGMLMTGALFVIFSNTLALILFLSALFLLMLILPYFGRFVEIKETLKKID